MRRSPLCQGQPAHTPGKGGSTSVKGEDSRKQNTLYALSHTRDAVYSRDPPYALITYTINYMYAVTTIVNRAIGTTWITVGVLKVPS